MLLTLYFRSKAFASIDLLNGFIHIQIFIYLYQDEYCVSKKGSLMVPI